jgi:hypothetical protein
MVITIKVRSPQQEPPLVLSPACVRVRARRLKVLDFDVEARPLHWISGDYVSKEITAIAWSFVGESKVECYLLGETDPVEMLSRFVEAYNDADMVTGHYIRGYDLPMVNGALTEHLLPALTDKLAQDTKTDLIPSAGLSKSQENIGAMLNLNHPKVKMDQSAWRDANRLTKSGRARARERVVGDVRQHIEMRARLLELGYLNPPKIWRSTSDIPDYVP